MRILLLAGLGAVIALAPACVPAGGLVSGASPSLAGRTTGSTWVSKDVGLQVLPKGNLTISFRPPFKHATIKASYVAVRGDDRQDRDLVFDFDPAEKTVVPGTLYLAGRFVSDPALLSDLHAEIAVLLAKKVPTVGEK